MARSFNGTAQITAASLATTNVVDWTIHALTIPATSQSTTACLIVGNGTTGASGYSFYITSSLALHLIYGAVNDYNTSTTLSTSSWSALTASNIAGTVNVYVNGSSVFNSTSNTPNAPAGGFYIGAESSLSHPYVGDIAEVAAWNVGLTNAEIVSLSKGYSPALIRPASLMEYIPLLRDNVSLKKGAPTISNATVSVHPKVYYPKRKAV